MQDEKIKLIHGDSFKEIKKIPDNSIDLILTDPPYNLGMYSTGNIKMSWRKDFNNDVAKWDKLEFNPKEWLTEFKRILKPSGNIFAFTSYNLIGKWHEAFDPEFDTFQFMVWHKTNPAPKIRRAGFLNSCELVICLWDKGHTWNFAKQNEMHNFIQTPICMGNERLKKPFHHPTQKPLKVLQHIIRLASNEGDVVFDPFMGVGSTGLASVALNRKFIGIELDPEYCKIAEARIEAWELNKQEKLNNMNKELKKNWEKEFNQLSIEHRKIGVAHELAVRIQHLNIEKRRLKKRHTQSLKEINEYIKNCERELAKRENEYNKVWNLINNNFISKEEVKKKNN